MKTLYGIFQHSVQMRENTDQKNSEHGLFLRGIFKRFQLFFSSFFLTLINPFHVTGLFLYPQKTSEN